MIRFDLICERDHEFDAWFKDSETFDKQLTGGDVTCPSCGSSAIHKALMAPNISTGKSRAAYVRQQSAPAELLEAMRKIRSHVEEKFDYVGDKFADEARKIHYDEAPERAIYGEATIDDIKELSEEGVDALPLPELPEDKN